MPLRKKIAQILRRISGMPETSTQVQQPHSVQDQTTSESTPSTPQKQHNKDATTRESKTFTVSELVLYGRPSCPYCARVDRAIVTMGIEDKITKRHTGSGTEWRADLRKRTGSTQVPCLFINGEPMFESLDIIAWMKANLA